MDTYYSEKLGVQRENNASIGQLGQTGLDEYSRRKTPDLHFVKGMQKDDTMIELEKALDSDLSIHPKMRSAYKIMVIGHKGKENKLGALPAKEIKQRRGMRNKAFI